MAAQLYLLASAWLINGAACQATREQQESNADRADGELKGAAGGIAGLILGPITVFFTISCWVSCKCIAGCCKDCVGAINEAENAQNRKLQVW